LAESINTKRAVIIGGGRIADYVYIKSQIREGDTVICADSGYDHAVNMGITPSVVVGDFDSISAPPQNVPAISYPIRKDFTDTEMAIKCAREQGFIDFLLLGVTGSRMDHSLTNILMLKDFVRRGEKAVIVDENNKITAVSSRVEINEPPGTIVSLVPIEDCKGVTTEGLSYPLCNADLRMGKGFGVSNVINCEQAIVKLASGVLLVIVARD